MSVRHSRTPSVGTRPRAIRRESVTSDAESAITSTSEQEKEPSGVLHHPSAVPLTPAPSIASTPSQSVFLPPPSDHPISRRSSFSSNAPGSPAQYSHIGRSPSPMPPLPAIRAPPSPQLIAQTRLYGDESFSSFFRRLTFSPDGGLLLTPSGHFEDPSNIGVSAWPDHDAPPSRGRRGNPDSNPASASSVFIYSRANFARPPIAQLPGHKQASVAVKFSPILYELRQTVVGAQTSETKKVVVERGNNEVVEVDLVGPIPKGAEEPESSSSNTQEIVRATVLSFASHTVSLTDIALSSTVCGRCPPNSYTWTLLLCHASQPTWFYLRPALPYALCSCNKGYHNHTRYSASGSCLLTGRSSITPSSLIWHGDYFGCDPFRDRN